MNKNTIALNLHNLNKSDIKFKLNRFPDGEVQVTNLEVDKLVEGMNFIVPIRNAEELFIYFQLMHLIHERIHQVNIIIPYLMGARNDRPMEEGRAVNLFNVLYLIGKEMFPKDTLTFITIHNEEAVREWFSMDEGENLNRIYFKMPYPEFKTNEEEMIIFPDKGAERRFKHLVDGPYLVAEKHRDINQSESKILLYDLLNPEEYDLTKLKKIIVIDDLIDGGRTFKLLSMLFEDIEKVLYATHFIQEDSLLTLADHYFNNIYICDTFRSIPEHENIHKLKDVEDIN